MSAGATYSQTATERVFIGRPRRRPLPRKRNAGRVPVVRDGEPHPQPRDRRDREIAKALGRRHAGTYDGMPAHAPRAAVLEAATQARAAKADLIVSIGGGSITDAAKIVTLCLKHDPRLMRTWSPTTCMSAATAPWCSPPSRDRMSVPSACRRRCRAGVNALSGATDEKAKLKQGYQHRLMAPVAVVLDPAMTVYTPEWLWLSTGVRALDHAMETLGSFHSNEFCDGVAENALAPSRRACRARKPMRRISTAASNARSAPGNP